MNAHRELPKDVAPLQLFGQEINPSTFAISRMNAFLHDMDAEIALGDTMRRPAFVSPTGGLRTFDIVTANPMWNQDFPDEMYRADTTGRFDRGVPPASSADWGWVQHMAASLKPGGRMAVVLDTGAVSRGSGSSGSNREREIRQAFVDSDLIEAVALLPENLFYNTSAPAIVMVINQAKAHPREVLLVNASTLFTKGRPKNELTDAHIATVHKLYAEWRSDEGVSSVITVDQISANDYNVSPSRYVAGRTEDGGLPLEEAVRLLREAETARTKADEDLWSALAELGVD
jgi:type I restriction enzyme M protein